VACEILTFIRFHSFFFFFFHDNCRKYSRVRKWTLGLSGGKDQIAVIRASGSISRVRSPLSGPGSAIIAEQFIEKIRSVRGIHDLIITIYLI
jgi:ClpP class serine protease